MSVVCLALCPEKIVLMGDTKLSDNENSNIIKKVFKRNDILLGVTGTVDDIEKYLTPIFNAGLTINERVDWGDYQSFTQIMDTRFYNAISSGVSYDVSFVTGGQIGNNLIAKMYDLRTDGKYNYQMETLISGSAPMRCFYLGKEDHRNYFNAKMEEKFPLDENGQLNVEALLDIFQATIDYGIEHDQSINNTKEYETLGYKPIELRIPPVPERYPNVTGRLGDPATMSCHTLTIGGSENDEPWYIGTINISPENN